LHIDIIKKEHVLFTKQGTNNYKSTANTIPHQVEPKGKIGKFKACVKIRMQIFRFTLLKIQGFPNLAFQIMAIEA